MMKKILLLFVVFISMTSLAKAHDQFYRGYSHADGSYVQPHYQSAPDSNIYNNYSTRGNTNPYTGQAGTVVPYGLNSNGLPFAAQPVGGSHGILK